MSTTPTQINEKSTYSVHESPSSVSVATVCSAHGSSQTPQLDKILQARPKAELQELTAAVNDLLHEDGCAKCAVQSAASIIMGCIQQVYAAKKDGKLSKEEKRELKQEVKGLVKGIKTEFKSQKKDLKAQRERLSNI